MNDADKLRVGVYTGMDFIDDFQPGYAPPTKGDKKRDIKLSRRVKHVQWETVNKGILTKEFVSVPRHLPAKLKEVMKAIKTSRTKMTVDE